MLGIALVDKPLGVTSHDVVAQLRRKLGTKRVGHAGTLDPMGRGLLVAAIGPATRFLQYLPLEPKVYIAEVTFGVESTTLDAEGELGNEKPVPADLELRLREAIPGFLGPVEQVPPMLSAVKVAGKPLYRYARAGQFVERKPRTVHIEAIRVLAVERPTARLEIVCSGGTYVRALAADLGRNVGCGAYLSALTRTKVGRFDLAQALPPEKVTPEHLLPLEEALSPMPIVSLDAVQAAAIRQGRTVGAGRQVPHRWVALREPDGPVFGVARVEGNQLRPECVLPSEATHG